MPSPRGDNASLRVVNNEHSLQSPGQHVVLTMTQLESQNAEMVFQSPEREVAVWFNFMFADSILE